MISLVSSRPPPAGHSRTAGPASKAHQEQARDHGRGQHDFEVPRDAGSSVVAAQENAPYPLRAIVALEPWSDLSGCHARRPRQRSSGNAVESRMGASTGATAPPRFPSPLIKPDVPISGIRLSDWLHRRLTNARPSAPGVAPPPWNRTPVPQGTGGCLATTPCDASSESAALCHRHARQPPGRPCLWNHSPKYARQPFSI